VTATPTATGSAHWITIAQEDFEGTFPAPGWQVLDCNAATGGEYLWAQRTCRPHTGTFGGWAIGGGADGSPLACGASYANNTCSVYVYGPFSLIDATDAKLAFYRWSNTELQWDKLFWGASIDGNSFYGVAATGDWSAWKYEEFDLTNVYTLGDLRGKPAVWIGFSFTSDTSNTYPEGAYLDDITMRKQVGGPLAHSAADPVKLFDESDSTRSLRPAVWRAR